MLQKYGQAKSNQFVRSADVPKNGEMADVKFKNWAQE